MGNAPIDCLLLAGGVPRPGEPLFEESRGGPKALLEIAGRPMIQWVLDALSACRRIGRVVAVGPLGDAKLDYAGDLLRVPGGSTWTDSFYAGIDHLDRSPGTLAAFCWSDIPLVRAAMLDRFLESVSDPPRLVHAGLVRRETLEGRFGRLPETYLRLAEGRFVAADFGVFQAAEAARLRRELDRLAPRRKSAWRQARTVGRGLLARYLAGRLALDGLERHLESRYGISCRVHIVDDPEMGLDVDGPHNLALCRRELATAPPVTSGVSHA